MAIELPPAWARLPGFGNLGLPIAVKEVRALVRRNRYFWTQFIYLSVLAIGVAVLMAANRAADVSPETVGSTIFLGFFILQNYLLLLVFPAFAATAISSERVEKSYDLLITTDLSPAEIVWGKFLGIIGNCCYFMLVALPLLGISILFGGISILHILAAYALLFVQAVLVVIYGLLVSASSKSNIRSILGTYVVVFLLFFPITGFYTQISVARMGGIPLAAMLGPALPPVVFWLPVVALYLAAALFCTCFLGATLHLSSPESNRVTPLRILVLAILTSGLALAGWLRLGASPANVAFAGIVDFWGVLTVSAICGAFLVIPLIGFSSTRVAPPLQTSRAAERRPWRARLLWLLLPGGVRGLAFSAFLILLAWVGLDWIAVHGYGIGRLAQEDLWSTVPPVGPIEALRLCWTLVGVWLLCCAALSFLLAALGVRGTRNWSLVFGFVLLVTLYAVMLLARDPIEPSSALSVSVVVTLVRFWSGQASDAGRLEAMRISTGIHGGIALVLTVAGIVALKLRGISVVGFTRPRMRDAPGGGAVPPPTAEIQRSASSMT